MTTLELLKEAIEVGHPRDAQALVYQCLEEGLSSSEIIDQAMIPAMKSAGEYYKNNDADIPRILSAARSVRKAYDILQEKFGSLEAMMKEFKRIRILRLLYARSVMK